MENINNSGDKPNFNPFDQFKKIGDKPSPLPGSFHNEGPVFIEEDIQTTKTNLTHKDFENISYPNLVKQYLMFKDKFQPKTDIVYYPCMANDTSPSVAFPDSKVIYADLDKDWVDSFKKAGFDSHLVSALEFNPGQVDILIMMNPQISPDIPASYVKEGGYILCNNYHSTADILHKKEDFKIRAVMNLDSGENPTFDTENLEDYWNVVESEDEIKKYDYFYTQAKNIVFTITKKTENIFAEYKKILEEAKEQMHHENSILSATNPTYAKLLSDPDNTDFLYYQYLVQTIHLSKLPYKKTGYTYIFQKI